MGALGVEGGGVAETSLGLIPNAARGRVSVFTIRGVGAAGAG